MTNFRLFKTDHVVLWRVLCFDGVASNSLFLLSHHFTVLPTSHDLLSLFVRLFELLRQSTMWIPLIDYNTAFHPFFCEVPTTLLPYNSTLYTLTNIIAHKSFRLAPDSISSNQHYFSPSRQNIFFTFFVSGPVLFNASIWTCRFLCIVQHI